MIKPNELRIGNLVDIPVNKHYPNGARSFQQVESISKDGINLVPTLEYGQPDIAEDIKAEYIEPIPLTPEILKDCGFKKPYGSIWRIVNKDLSWSMSLTYTGNGYMTTTAFTNYSLKYLHQLQNLYFTLTGEELTEGVLLSLSK